MPYMEVNHLNIYYQVEGSGDAPAVIFIGGLSGDHRTWARACDSLKGSFKTICFDNRDSGLSQRAWKPYSILDMAKDTAGLLKSLDIQKAHVVGYSMGGAIAQELAISFPDIVDRLVLIATYDMGDARGQALFRGLALLREQLDKEAYVRITMPLIYSHKEYEAHGFIENAIKQLSEDDLFQEVAAYNRQMEATIAFNSRDRLRAISCPTLLLFGAEDVITPQRFATEMVNNIEGSRLITFEGAGHGLVYTRMNQVVAITEQFLLEEYPG